MNNFLKKVKPEKIIILGCLLWLLLFLIAPLEIKVNFTIDGVIFLILNLLFLLCGIFFMNSIKLRLRTQEISNLCFRSTIFLGLLCVILKVYDKVVLRGGVFFESVLDNRDSFESVSSNNIAIVHSILTGFTYIPLFLYSHLKKKNKILFVILLALFFSTILDIFLIGSRSNTLLSFFLFIYYFFSFNKIRINFIKVFSFTLILILIGIWMGVIFIERSKEFAGDGVITYILTSAGYTEVIGPNDRFVNFVNNIDSDIFQTVLVSYATLINYYVHGIIEFLFVFDHFNANYTFGKYSFFIYYKFVSIIFGNGVPEFSVIANVNPRPAVYTSFFGPIFFDFGWLSIFFSFILGIVSSYIYRKAKFGNINYTIIYSYFISLLFFIPVFNFLEGASGLYVITSFLIFNLFISKI